MSVNAEYMRASIYNRRQRWRRWRRDDDGFDIVRRVWGISTALMSCFIEFSPYNVWCIAVYRIPHFYSFSLFFLSQIAFILSSLKGVVSFLVKLCFGIY